MELVFDYTQAGSVSDVDSAAEAARLNEWTTVLQHFVGHDLANHLVFLQGTARLLLAERLEQADDQERDLLNRLAERAQQADRQARRLAEIGRLLRLPALDTAYRLDELIEESLARVRLRQANVACRFQVRCPSLSVVQSRPLLSAVLTELLHNAMASLRSDRPGTIDIDASSGETPKGWWLRVSDNGRGFPDGAESLIRDPFAAARQSGCTGRGSGLLLVRQALSRWHGRLTFLSSPESGTQVCCWFPGGEAIP